MLRYLVRISEDEREKNGDRKPLPRVVPVVLYHGTRLWRDTTEFADLVDGTEPGDRHVPHFQPLFVNLADLTEAQLHGSLRTIITRWSTCRRWHAKRAIIEWRRTR